ncbi:hypothetical protein CsSME_00003342 [Camellia sinensis var. sinensis]
MASSSSSELTFKLYPLVILNISDHYTCLKFQSQPPRWRRSNHFASSADGLRPEGTHGQNLQQLRAPLRSLHPFSRSTLPREKIRTL